VCRTDGVNDVADSCSGKPAVLIGVLRHTIGRAQDRTDDYDHEHNRLPRRIQTLV
jgi:hypothetical protein